MVSLLEVGQPTPGVGTAGECHFPAVPATPELGLEELCPIPGSANHLKARL